MAEMQTVTSTDHSSLRRQRLLSDIDLIVRVCTYDTNNPFCQFEFNNDLFSFEYRSGNTRIFYRISLSESYPDTSIMTSCVNASDTQHETTYFSDRLPVVFNELAAKMYKPLDLHIVDDKELAIKSDKLSFLLPRKTSVYQRRVSASGTDDDNDDDDDDDEDEGSMDSDDIDDAADDYIDTDDVDDSLCIDSELMSDVESVKAVYGADMIHCRYLKAIGDVDVKLSVSIRSLDVEVSKAWNLIHLQPLIIFLHLSMSRYRTGQEPKVEVLQYSLTGSKEKTGVHKQMEKILERFIAENWSKPPVTKQDAAADDLSGWLNPITQLKKLMQKPLFAEADVSRLMQLGYTKAVSVYALEACHGNINKACDMLLECGADLMLQPLANDDLMPTVTQKTEIPTPTKLAKKEKTKPVSPSEKDVPPSTHGFLVQLMLYAAKRLSTLNEFCVVCDERHLFENASMLKPVVCSRELCVFAFQTLGVMADAADEVATAAEVVDLLVAMARAAARSKRKQLIFEPYPSVVDPRDSRRLAFSPEKKNFDLVLKTLQNIPRTSEMATKSRGELKKMIDRLDRLAHPLLQWIVSSNRCHIVKLPPQKQLKFMQTPHQFVLHSSPPAKEVAFIEARSQHGSTFAFHGSHIENWHSIMRRGLLNASNTRLEVNGSVYGAGIYLSPTALTSFSYSKYRAAPVQEPDASSQTQSAGANQFLASDDITCIALCEVVTSQQLHKYSRVWLMPDPDQVCTRFFFVYENGVPLNSDVDSQSHDVVREIGRVMSMIYT